jgi:hypothetical protein
MAWAEAVKQRTAARQSSRRADFMCFRIKGAGLDGSSIGAVYR